MKGKKANDEDKSMEDGEEGDEDEDFNMYEDEWDSEGLEGDAELQVNEQNEDEPTTG